MQNKMVLTIKERMSIIECYQLSEDERLYGYFQHDGATAHTALFMDPWADQKNNPPYKKKIEICHLYESLYNRINHFLELN